MNNSNRKRAAFLGMPFGTACGRLRKNILFHLLKRLNENVCFKCREVIETSKELSVEHKLPWEGISVELFWDLENISFSHLRCNRPHRRSNQKYFTPEEKLVARRATGARLMRKHYTTEKRRLKKERTGW
jgi:hypothetical protein